MIQVTVMGQPAPQGSKRYVGQSRAGRGILVESSAKVKPWREDVRAACERFIETCAVMRDVSAGYGPGQIRDVRVVPNGDAAVLALPLDCPLRVRMVFTLPAPASLPKKRPSHPMRLPDLSKLVRSTEDAITSAGLWRDDARVVECTAAKTYPAHVMGAHPEALPAPGCRITIELYP